MNSIRDNIKNNMLLTLVFISYIALLILMPNKAAQSFNNSLYYVKEMLIIMPVILLLTSLIEAWIPKKTIENALGEGSGFKGSILSFLLGSFSAGPIYAAFPVCKMLLKKGTSVSNIVIMLSTWAVIKIPMLANESKFLGPKFMAIRWALTTIAIFLMAYITSIIVRKEDIPMDDMTNNKEGTILNVNENYCIGCGICTKISPDNFILINKKAKLVKKTLKSDETENIKDAIQRCPAKAIQYKE
ncbi:permease [Clostridium frigoris]|uniref:Ferredoxin n=1 Tax=Clostridium frigoris TaxID=205327 RepID=A0ABS6BXN7_9CLOT|nr:permease [Clostridium frigoris]MBU3161368.1 permease [Clostridium frigoris]